MSLLLKHKMKYEMFQFLYVLENAISYSKMARFFLDLLYSENAMQLCYHSGLHPEYNVVKLCDQIACCLQHVFVLEEKSYLDSMIFRMGMKIWSLDFPKFILMHNAKVQ